MLENKDTFCIEKRHVHVQPNEGFFKKMKVDFWVFFPQSFFFQNQRKSCSVTLQSCKNGSLTGTAVGVKDDGKIRHNVKTEM